MRANALVILGMPSLNGNRVRPALARIRDPSLGAGRQPRHSNVWKEIFCPCWPAREKKTAAPPVEKGSLLSNYGIDELSDTESEGTPPEKMTPEQIQMMIDRRTHAGARTQH